MATQSKQGFSGSLGLVVVIFVALVGALGYQYVMNYKAKVANTTNSKQIAAETMTVPNIKTVSDLDKANQALETAAKDDLSANDLDKLSEQISKF